jgi:uncharacterized protein (DUF1778 family)
MAATKVTNTSARVQLSERDTLRILDLLENPPKPPARLVHAAETMRR